MSFISLPIVSIVQFYNFIPLFGGRIRERGKQIASYNSSLVLLIMTALIFEFFILICVLLILKKKGEINKTFVFFLYRNRKWKWITAA